MRRVGDHIVLIRVFIDVQSLSVTIVMWHCAQRHWKTASLVLRARWLAPTEGHCRTQPSLTLMTVRSSTSAGTGWCPSLVIVQQGQCTTRSPSSAMSRKTFLDGKQKSAVAGWREFRCRLELRVSHFHYTSCRAGEGTFNNKSCYLSVRTQHTILLVFERATSFGFS